MSSKGYTAIGYLVWKGVRWYVRRRFGSRITSGTVAVAGGAVAASIGVAIAVLARRRRA